MPPISFKFSLRPGDLINALAGVRAVCEKQHSKAIIYLGLDIQWQTVPELQLGREEPVTMTRATMEFLRPLLLEQRYIQDVRSLEEDFPEMYNEWIEVVSNPHPEVLNEWYQSHKMVDLDRHHLMPIGLPAGNLFRSNFYIYPDMACDLSKPWIEVPPVLTFRRPLIVNRTPRVRNTLTYDFLQRYKDLMFVGLAPEYDQFMRETGLDIQWAQTKNAYDLARVIRAGRGFVGNQSLAFSLAEAMKVPRVLEICPWLPNVIPAGEHGYDCYFQHAFEYYCDLVDKL